MPAMALLVAALWLGGIGASSWGRGQSIVYVQHPQQAELRRLEGQEALPLVETKRLVGEERLSTLRKLRGKIVVLGFLGAPGQFLRRPNVEQIQFFRKLRDLQRPDTYTILTFAQAQAKEDYEVIELLRSRLNADELKLYVRMEWTPSAPFHRAYGLDPRTLPEPLFVVVGKRGKVAVAGCNHASLPSAIRRARRGS